MNKKIRKNNAITLIALIITIIILLILAGLSIQALTNTGLFGKAKEANTETRGASVQEARDLWKMNEELDNYGGNTTVKTLEELLNDLENQKLITSEERTKIEKSGEVTIGSRTIVFKEKTLADWVKPGDYVAYTPDTAITDSILAELETYSGSTENTESTVYQESLNWRVLDIIDGKVRLISELPTISTVMLSGYNGYNNAVYLLDKTCSTLYNNSTYAKNVQNLKIEDIQKYITITDYSTINSDYGTTFSPTYKYYPSILTKEKDQTVNELIGTLNLSEQNEPINQSSNNTASSWTLKYTYWNNNALSEDYFTDAIYYNLFRNNGSAYDTYWISSRCINAYSHHADFIVYHMNPTVVNAGTLYNSYDSSRSGSYALRPIITINSNVKIDTTDETKNGSTAENPWILKID